MIEKYITYLTAIRGYSENTAIAYEKNIRHFAQWARRNVKDARWSTITQNDIDAYIISQQREGLKPSTTNQRLASISGFYNYLRREGHDIPNPCKYESRRKIAKNLPNTIPPAQLKEAYNHAVGMVKLWIGLLSTTGIRIQELLDMTWEDIDFETQSIRVNGKGSKQRIVYTNKEILEPLEAVKNLGKHSGRLFNIEQREARKRIWEALKPYCQAPQLSPHAIRHTFATHAANIGANVTQIAHVLGHEDIKTTQKYIDMTQTCTPEVSRSFSLFN